MTVQEWNDVLRHAKEIETDDIKTRVYTMYNGRKGIRVLMYDLSGDIFAYYNTGINDSKAQYIKALDYAKKRLMHECV